MSEDDTLLEETLEQLPLDAWHRAHGARMVPFAGYEMPIQYTGEHGGIVAEHEWTRHSASLFDVSHMGQLTISGEGVQQALEAVIPANLAALKDGCIRYSYFLNEEGGMIDDIMVTRMGDAFGLVVNGACKWNDIGHLREFLADEITINHHDDKALLALQGPKAAEVLEAIVPGTSALVFMTAAAFTWNGVPLWVARAGYTGEDGFEISVPAENVAAFADALMADSRVHGAGLGARDSLRLEAALPLYGHDLSEEIDPVSADLTFAIGKLRREAGGFIGHAPIMDKLNNGTAQKRVGLSLDGRLPAREGAKVFIGEAEVGHITSGGFSPSLGHPIAMAYINTEHTAIGTALEVEVRGKRLSATITAMPFVPHNYYRG